MLVVLAALLMAILLVEACPCATADEPYQFAYQRRQSPSKVQMTAKVFRG